MIDGIHITPLTQISDNRGKIMHMLRCDSTSFEQFGEIYFSCIYPGAIKGWSRHHRMVLNYAVPVGNIQLVLYDDRLDSPTYGEVQSLIIGSDSYQLVTIPPLIWVGFKGLGSETALLANCASIVHDPAEMDRKDPFDAEIPYKWTSD